MKHCDMGEWDSSRERRVLTGPNACKIESVDNIGVLRALLGVRGARFGARARFFADFFRL